MLTKKVSKEMPSASQRICPARLDAASSLSPMNSTPAPPAIGSQISRLRMFAVRSIALRP